MQQYTESGRPQARGSEQKCLRQTMQAQSKRLSSLEGRRELCVHTIYSRQKEEIPFFFLIDGVKLGIEVDGRQLATTNSQYLDKASPFKTEIMQAKLQHIQFENATHVYGDVFLKSVPYRPTYNNSPQQAHIIFSQNVLYSLGSKISQCYNAYSTIHTVI